MNTTIDIISYVTDGNHTSEEPLSSWLIGVIATPSFGSSYSKGSLSAFCSSFCFVSFCCRFRVQSSVHGRQQLRITFREEQHNLISVGSITRATSEFSPSRATAVSIPQSSIQAIKPKKQFCCWGNNNTCYCIVPTPTA